MSVNKQYAKEIHGQFGYLATWLPTANVKLGDVGTIRDGIFEKIGTLKDFGIAHTEQVDPQTGDLEYTSSEAVAVEFKAAADTPVTGTVPGKLDGTVAVSFSRPNAVLFQASQCTTSTITNLKQVADTILSQYREGNWPSDRVVVTEVVSSAAATVLISNGANAHINLAVKGEIGAEKAKLASADAKFEVKSYSAIGTRIIAEKGSTPLFKARGIKTPWLHWRAPSFETKADDRDLQLAPLDYVDLVSPPGERAG